jgi:putative endonuclease
MAGGYVYIMTNETSGTLYVGVTADLVRRVTQHREGRGGDFCKRYGLKRLVYVEHYERIEEAIWREKALKAWRRGWKLDLVEKANPGWADLYLDIHP